MHKRARNHKLKLISEHLLPYTYYKVLPKYKPQGKKEAAKLAKYWKAVNEVNKKFEDELKASENIEVWGNYK